MQDVTIDTYFVDGILSKSEEMIQLWGGYAIENRKRKRSYYWLHNMSSLQTYPRR